MSYERSTLSVAKVMDKCSYTSAPSVLLHVADRDSVTFTFYLYFSHDGHMASNHTFFSQWLILVDVQTGGRNSRISSQP